MNTRIVNLTFHGIGDPPPAAASDECACWIEAARFRALLDVIQTADRVQITVDDGHVSDMHVVLPALRKRNLLAVFFVCAAHVGQPAYLAAGDLRELAAAGMTIGSHGMRHVPWRGLSEARLREEIVNAKDQLEQALGQPITYAACPFGQYDRRCLRALRDAAFTRVYISDIGAADADAWLQARNTLHTWDNPASLRRILSPPDGFASRWSQLKTLVKQWR